MSGSRRSRSSSSRPSSRTTSAWCAGPQLHHGGPRSRREIVLQRARRGHDPPGCSAEHLLDFEALRGRARPARDLLLLGRGHRTRRPAAAHLGRHVLRRGPPLRGDLPPGRTTPADRPRTKSSRGQRPAADQLAELQKEIINGTWKLIRRETGAKPSEKFAEDGKVLAESQHRRSSRPASLAERLRDAASKASLEQATRFMKDAEKQLAEAVAENTSIAALRPPWPPSKPLTRLCSSSAPANSRSSAATRGSGRAAGARPAARRNGSSSSSSSPTTKTATRSSARPGLSRRDYAARARTGARRARCSTGSASSPSGRAT